MHIGGGASNDVSRGLEPSAAGQSAMEDFLFSEVGALARRSQANGQPSTSGHKGPP